MGRLISWISVRLLDFYLCSTGDLAENSAQIKSYLTTKQMK